MAQASLFSASRRLARKISIWLSNWRHIVLFSAVTLVLMLSPSTYSRDCRGSIARQIVQATVSNLMWFSVLSALISVVLIRIVVVTALSYGLSQFAIEMVVRVLVLELIPLSAALFVALRYTLPASAEIGQMRAQGTLDALQRQGIDPMRQEFFPRVLAGIFSVWMLGAVSCIMTLVLAYLALYGFTPWGLAVYTRIVGHVFNPAVTLILLLKIFFFSLAISLIPIATLYYDKLADMQPLRTELATSLAGMVRLFACVLLIEVASLMGNYY